MVRNFERTAWHALIPACLSILVSAAPHTAVAAAADDRFVMIIKRYVATANDGTIVALKPSSGDLVGIWRPGSDKSDRLLRAGSKINSLDVSPDGKLVVTGDDHNDAIVWDASTGNRTAVLPHPKRVTSVAFMQAGQKIVTGCGDGVTRLWHSTGGPPIWEYPKKLPWGEVFSVIVSPSNELIASTGGRSSVLNPSGNSVMMSFPGGQVIAFSQDSTQAFTASWGFWPESWSVVAVVDTKSRKAIWRYQWFDGAALGLAISPRGALGVSAVGNPFSGKCAIVLWDSRVQERQPKVLKTLAEQEECMTNFAFSKDGKSVVGRKSSGLVVWDVETARPTRLLRD